MMSRRSTRITIALERLGSTSPESKQNDVNDEIESHPPPPPLNKRTLVEAKERDTQVLVSLQKQFQEVEARHTKQVKEYIINLEKHVHIYASHKSSHKDDNNDNDNNNDEDDDTYDDNNDEDAPEVEIADVVEGNKILTARRVTYKEGKCYQNMLCSIRVKYFIFVTC